MGIDQHRDQRKSYRCAVDPTRQPCELQVGSRAAPAKLLDESAGGFSVLVHHPPELTLNQTARLRKDGNWFNVRVVHIQAIARKTKHNAEASAEPHVDTETNAEDVESWPSLRLGLRRLGDAELPDQTGVSLLVSTLRFRLSQWKSSGMVQMIVYGVLLAVVIVVIPFGMMNFGRHIQIPKTEGQPKPNIQTTNAPSSADAGANQSAFVKGHASASPSGRAPLDSMLDLPGVAPFTLPEVIERLRLTADQQKRIDQLIEAATEALRKLGEQLPGVQRNEISWQREELLDHYRHKALGLLTEQQRAEWKKLTGEP